MKKILSILLSVILLIPLCACQSDTSLFEEVAPADEALARCKTSAVVVIEESKCTHGEQLMKDFYDKTKKGEEAELLCAMYYNLDGENISEELYEQEKDNYPQLYYYLVSSKDDSYIVKIRKSDEEQIEQEASYSCLMHYQGDAPKGASFSSYDYYVLTRSDTVTWDEIEKGLFSSQLDDYIPHCMIYRNTF